MNGHEHYKRIFQTDPSKIDEMISLRQKGWSYPVLAKKYNVDHTSIVYWCKKRGLIIPKPILIVKKIETKPLTEEKLNEGKNYQEYLDYEKNRRFNELLK